MKHYWMFSMKTIIFLLLLLTSYVSGQEQGTEDFEKVTLLVRVIHMGGLAKKQLEEFVNEDSSISADLHDVAHQVLEDSSTTVVEHTYQEIEAYIINFSFDQNSDVNTRVIEEMGKAIEYANSAKNILARFIQDEEISLDARLFAIPAFGFIPSKNDILFLGELLGAEEVEVRLAAFHALPIHIQREIKCDFTTPLTSEELEAMLHHIRDLLEE